MSGDISSDLFLHFKGIAGLLKTVKEPLEFFMVIPTENETDAGK